MNQKVTHILHEAHDEPEANVVLVHGALDRGMAFRAVVQRLHSYDTTVYDRRGYGASLAMGPAESLDDHVGDLLGIIDRTPSIVIGHSYGGLIAMLAAAQSPEVILALGVYEPPLPGIQMSQDPTAQQPPTDPEHLVRWMYRRVVGESAFDRMSPNAQKALVAEAPALESDLRLVRDCGGPFNPSIVAVPTLVAHGAASIARHIERAEWLAAQLPQGSLLETPEASHGAHRTHPEHFAAFVKAAVALGA